MALFGGEYFAAHSVCDSAGVFSVLVGRTGRGSTHVRGYHSASKRFLDYHILDYHIRGEVRTTKTDGGGHPCWLGPSLPPGSAGCFVERRFYGAVDHVFNPSHSNRRVP